MLSPDFRGYIDARMAAREIGTYGEVADLADVSRDTLQRWFRGEGAPSPRAAGKVARVLGVGYGELLAAYEGRPTMKEPPTEVEGSLATVLSELASAIRDQTRLIEAFAEVQGQQSVQVETNSTRIDRLDRVLRRLVERDRQEAATPRSPRRTGE